MESGVIFNVSPLWAIVWQNGVDKQALKSAAGSGSSKDGPGLPNQQSTKGYQNGWFSKWQVFVGDGPNTVSGSTVSNTELSEFFGPHRDPGGKLSEFLSAYYLCAKANSPSFSQNSPSLPQNSVRLIEFSSPKQYSRNSIPPVS